MFPQVEIYNDNDKLNHFIELVQLYLTSHSVMPHVAIPTSEGIEFVPKTKILYIEADGSYSKILLTCGRKIILSKNLKNLERLLDKNFFMRVHQSFIINLQYIHKYIRGQGGYLVLQNGKHIPVSRSRKEDVIRLSA